MARGSDPQRSTRTRVHLENRTESNHRWPSSSWLEKEELYPQAATVAITAEESSAQVTWNAWILGSFPHQVDKFLVIVYYFAILSFEILSRRYRAEPSALVPAVLLSTLAKDWAVTAQSSWLLCQWIDTPGSIWRENEHLNLWYDHRPRIVRLKRRS